MHVAATLAVVPIAFGVGLTTNQQWPTYGPSLMDVVVVMVPANLVVVVQLPQEWGSTKKKNTRLTV